MQDQTTSGRLTPFERYALERLQHNRDEIERVASMPHRCASGITDAGLTALRLEHEHEQRVWLRMASQLPELSRTFNVALTQFGAPVRTGDLIAAVRSIATADLLELIGTVASNMPLHDLMRDALLCRASKDDAAAVWRDRQDFRSPVVKAHAELVEQARRDGETDEAAERRLEGEATR